MRAAVSLIILTILACAVLASHQRKPFPLLVQASAPRHDATFVCSPTIPLDARKLKAKETIA